MLNNFTRLTLLLVIFICAISGQSCNIINPHEPTPTYVHIDSFSFQQNSATTFLNKDGSPVPVERPVLSHYITSVWVYYNGSRIGLFDLPATFPVVATGTGKLEVAPAIALDGRNINVAAYPFYETDTFTLVAQPGKIVNYTPSTSFYSDATVKIIDYFFRTKNFGPAGGNRGMTYETADSLLYPGSLPEHGVGEIKLLAVGDSSVDSTLATFSIPTGLAFIEFDYKSTIPFYVGLQAKLSKTISAAPYYLSGVKPSGEWQKFYLQVDGYTAQAQGTSSVGVTYNFYIKAVLADEQSSGRLLIDNIHLVTF